MKKKIGDYIMEERIGVGAFGEVYKAKHVTKPEIYAIKMINKKTMSQQLMNYLEREVTLLQKCDHPNVVRLKDLRATDNHYYLVFEYCNGGDLLGFRRTYNSGNGVSEELVRNFTLQIISGMNAIFSQKAIHRDIKLSNIMLSYPTEEARAKQEPILKLGDFGFARLLGNDQGKELQESECEQDIAMSIVGTPINMAPELFKKSPYSFKADIWSLGTIIYELLCGNTCFNGINRQDLIKNIDRGLYKLPLAIHPSLECLSFLNQCLQQDPAKRSKWKNLVTHPFVANLSIPVTKVPYEELLSMNKSPPEGHAYKMASDGTNLCLFTQARYNFNYVPVPVRPPPAKMQPEKKEEKKVPEQNLAKEGEEKKSPPIIEIVEDEDIVEITRADIEKMMKEEQLAEQKEAGILFEDIPPDFVKVDQEGKEKKIA